MKDLSYEIQNQNKRAVARLISMLENNDPRALEILKETWHGHKKSRIIGITGPPGAGKSTLTDKLAKALLKEDKKIGILAVDPSSPLTGGALLGDRVRMSDLNAHPHVFIRSFGSRGSLGGISKAIYGAIRVLSLYGMDYIFIETVGIGQSEVDIRGVSDTVVLVAVPGLGDDIQAGKGGILEVADIIAVNKADQAEADRSIWDLRSMLSPIAGEENGPQRVPVIIKTVASKNLGTGDLLWAIEDHFERLCQNEGIEILRQQQLKSELRALVLPKLNELFLRFDASEGKLDQQLQNIMDQKTDLYSAATAVVQEFIQWEGKKC